MPKWSIQRVYYIDKNGESHGVFIDMMGFQIYRDRVEIRKSIFLKIKRKTNKVRKKIKNHEAVSLDDAYQMCSYNGWVKNTNSEKFSKANEVALCMRVSKQIISRHSKAKHYNDFNDKYTLIYSEGEKYDRILQSFSTN